MPTESSESEPPPSGPDIEPLSVKSNGSSPRKASIKGRFSRMFSSRDIAQLNAASKNSNSGDRADKTPGTNSVRPPPLGGISSSGRRERGKSVAEHAEESTPSTAQAQTAREKDESQRFVLDADVPGGHEHRIKSSQKQNKLSDVWKGIFGKSFSETPALVEKYGKCQGIIGRGAFGVVRVSHKKVEGGGEKLFAVKEFRRWPEETAEGYGRRLTSGYSISSSLHHPNVVCTLDLLQDAQENYCEVMEFYTGGDLYALISASGKLEVQEADCFFKQLMRGVEYLHEMGVAHRDLKPENLLLTSRGALKISDFGNSECVRLAWETEPHMVSGLCGSAPYIAPEEHVQDEYDGRAVDVWACGVVYMAMRIGRHLWHLAKDDDELYTQYIEDRRLEEGYAPIESLKPARCRNVIYSILDPQSGRRLTAAQVLKSPWLREIEVCKAGEDGL